LAPVDGIFNPLDERAPAATQVQSPLIVWFMTHNETLKWFLIDGAAIIHRELRIKAPNSTDEGMNLPILNPDRASENAAEWEILRVNYTVTKLDQRLILYDQLVCPRMFWNVKGDCGRIGEEPKEQCTTRIRRVLIYLIAVKTSLHAFNRNSLRWIFVLNCWPTLEFEHSLDIRIRTLFFARQH
jgi:hypothetical protein